MTIRNFRDTNVLLPNIHAKDVASIIKNAISSKKAASEIVSQFVALPALKEFRENLEESEKKDSEQHLTN
jgi:hypothetical protein